MGVFRALRGLKLAVVITAGLAMAACAKKADESTLGPGGPGGPGGIATPGSPQDFVVNVGDRVFFETDSTELTPTAQNTLTKQAAWLKRYGQYAFTVEGHADERGTREYNIALGQRRAQVTRDFLAAQGINPSRIRVISYGKERPVAVCDDISCWSQNRRAVTVLGGPSS